MRIILIPRIFIFIKYAAKMQYQYLKMIKKEIRDEDYRNKEASADFIPL